MRERLRPFDVRVIVYDPFISEADAQAPEVERVPLEKAFQRADIVSVRTPLLPETGRKICGYHFAATPRGATFIDIARGPIVQLEMVDALRNQPEFRAVLAASDPEAASICERRLHPTHRRHVRT